MVVILTLVSASIGMRDCITSSLEFLSSISLAINIIYDRWLMVEASEAGMCRLVRCTQIVQRKQVADNPSGKYR